MAFINKQDTDGTKSQLAEGELGYDKQGSDRGRVYVGTNNGNLALGTKREITTLNNKVGISTITKPILSANFAEQEYSYRDAHFGQLFAPCEDIIDLSRSSVAYSTDPTGMYVKNKVGELRITYDATTGEPLGALVEETRTNLFTYSNQFTVSDWVKENGSTVESVTLDNPLGSTAYKHISVGTAMAIRQYFTITGGAELTSQFCVKKGSSELQRVVLYISDSAAIANRVEVVFNLSTGTIESTASFGTFTDAKATVRNMNNGFYLLSLSGKTDVATTAIYAKCVGKSGEVIVGSFYYIAFAQLEVGSTPSSYIPDATQFNSRSSTATYFDSTGTLKTAAINEARYSYNPANLRAEPALLLEEARTNLRLNSQNIYAATGTTVVPDTHRAPDGILMMDSLYETATTGEHLAADMSIIPTAGVYYTWSCFARVGSTDRNLLLRVASGNIAGVIFNLSTGVSTVNAGANLTSYSFTPIGDGIYRCSVTILAANASHTVFRLQLANGTTTSYAGDTTKFIPIWGVQLEVGSYPTSYIPTTATEVTRAADIATGVQATRVRDVLSQYLPFQQHTQFSVYLDINVLYAYDNAMIFKIHGETDGINQGLGITAFGGGTTFALSARVSGVNRLGSTSLATGLSGFNKALMVVDGDVVKLYVNGYLASTMVDTFTKYFLSSTVIKYSINSPYKTTALSVGNYLSIQSNVRDFKIYPRALSDAEAVELTS